MVAYTGILAGTCRSAEGLKTILSSYFGGIPVAIKQWMPRWAPVSDLKQMGKNSVLGLNTMIGTHIQDTGGKFRVILGPLEKDDFVTFLPEKSNISVLKEIVTGYTTDPLSFDIEVRLKPTALVPVVLGEKDAQLGIGSSCGKSSEKADAYSIVIGN
jgi:type VI secretion system protein ImpH